MAKKSMVQKVNRFEVWWVGKWIYLVDLASRNDSLWFLFGIEMVQLQGKRVTEEDLIIMNTKNSWNCLNLQLSD